MTARRDGGNHIFDRALTVLMIDNECRPRVVRSINRLDNRPVVIFDASVNDPNFPVVREQDSIGGAQVRGQWIADRAGIDDDQPVNFAFKRNMRMSDANDIRMAFFRERCQFHITGVRADSGAIGITRRCMHAQ